MRVTTLTRYGVQATMIGLLGGLSGCFMPSLGTGFENSTFFSSNSEDTSALHGVPCSNEAPPSSLSSCYAVRCASCHGNEGEGGVYKSLRGNLSESAYISVIRG